MPENTKASYVLFLSCKNLTHVYNLTISGRESNPAIDSSFATLCPNLKEVSFEGAHRNLYFTAGNLCPETITFQDDVSFNQSFGLFGNPSIKQIHVPMDNTGWFILENEHDRHNVGYEPIPSFESYIMQDYFPNVTIQDNPSLEVVYLRYDSMHSGVKIDNCPNLREIIIEDADEVLEKAMQDYSEESIEYDSYLDLSNLPSLESVTCYRPETNMYVRAEECGDFTMYGSKDNTKLQEVCETKDIPYSFLDGCEAYETGDVDGSGNINIMDVILINRYLMIGANISPEGLEAADVNQDGEIDAVDSPNLLRYIVGIDKILGK